MTGSNTKTKEGSMFISGNCDYSSHTLNGNKSAKVGNCFVLALNSLDMWDCIEQTFLLSSLISEQGATRYHFVLCPARRQGS